MAAPFQPNDDIITAFTACGLDDATRDHLLKNERLSSLALFADVRLRDIQVMVDSNRKRPSATCCDLTIMEKNRLEGLLCWCKDRVNRELPLDVELFTPDVMRAMTQRVEAETESTTDPAVTDIRKFDPSDYDMCEEAFRNLAARTTGHQVTLTGELFEKDNKKLWGLLKAWLVNSASWTWIESYGKTNNGHGAWLAMVDHYNGDGERNKRVQLAKASIETLHYKNEHVYSFETMVSKLKAAFTILEKDPNRRYTPQAQVDHLLDRLQPDNMELIAAKNNIHMLPLEPLDTYFERACALFSAVVTSVYKSKFSHDTSGNRKRRTLEVSRRHYNKRGGRGRGRGQGKGRGNGKDGRDGGDRHSRRHVINGVDCTDVFRRFTPEEFQKLDKSGQYYIHSERRRLGGTNPSNADRRNVSSVNGTKHEDDTPTVDVPASNASGNSRGGRNGTKFGENAVGG
ncbi:hypothetical protein IV203_027806 [Nitzschia inconspicua]|uniref:Gag protein n=1 Tax=Nitzschia inconspicua TaxID=303405 RepID=A0A9K3Q4G8_9STRA|nr:hypothetical protein IV203_027806 [Nitzschia inconspicua]